jgi:serine O-acetyltransferase
MVRYSLDSLRAGKPYLAMLDSINAVTAALLSSYKRIGGINHLDGSNLPSRLAVSSIVADYASLIFPGYREEFAPDSQDLAFITAEKVNRLAGC